MKLEQIKEYEREQPNKINDFFDSSYSKIYSELLDVELESQVNFLENTYLKSRLKNKIKVLDLCCGTGRHIKKLSDKGYSIDGVDMNPQAVNIAQENLAQGKIYLSDVQFFNPNIKYDLIYSMESSIGYLPDNQTVDIFKNISTHLLSDNGVVVLHLTNRDYLMKNLGQRVWFGNAEHGYLLENRTFDLEEGILKINQIRIIDGIDKKYSIDLRLYSLKELSCLLSEAGLLIAKVYGDYNNDKFDINAPYMIVECSKRH
ncbi:class I SAM-dependent methyltransferase [Streptococcus ferus]|uniref:SAM-dependent methyltransferase n=1 Tax=Streptococcus ferus TaxID=1345 RepID=A0A2X3WBB1_9STRE|nr:class I SAM-dependent methyltransferase [Streptococcus ferus]SQF41223.1 SAM-dependent methyltransferase [Streptococcus ferus]